MNKKKVMMGIVLIILLGFVLFKSRNDAYQPADDEIAVHLQLNTEEDVGLIVFDYWVNDSEYSGGISNADKSLLKQDSDNVLVWNKQELNVSNEIVKFVMQLRIITEYVQPNYENVYPDKITQYLEKVSWKASFGHSYDVVITGNKISGYKAEINES